LPFYYALANDFAIGDRYFSSVQGPTFPNRFYLYAGTSFGHIDNDPPPPGGYTQPTVFRSMTGAHVSWKIYNPAGDGGYAGAFFADVRQHLENSAPIDQFFADAKAGRLPQVSFVDPGGSQSEHPPDNIQVGEAFSASIVEALLGSPNWHDSAMFLTYDEHGGFYDHVPPPAAPPPDDIPPSAGSGPWTFNQYGVRVPLIVISPYTMGHDVSHTVYDHTSLLRFIEVRFGLPSLTNRDAQARPLLDFFDFSHPDLLTPPALPPAPIDAAHASQCASLGVSGQ
jgi:phospholipase C